MEQIVRTTPLLLVRGVRFLVVVFLFFLASTTTTTTYAFAPSRWTTTPSSRQSIIVVESSGSSSPPPPPKTIHPPLSKKEIEEWLDYIPVYTITDPEGKFIYIEPNNKEEKVENNRIFNFYISREMAETTRQQLKLQTDSRTSDIGSDDLKLSAFSLGRIWFDLLMAKSKDNNNNNNEKDDTENDDDDDEEKEYHLVASEQDLLGARMLLTMGPEEEEELMKASSSPQEQKRILDRINEESPKFKAMSLNEIPIFMISQMRIQVDKDQEKKAMIPMYLSNEGMIETYQDFLVSASNNKEASPPAEPSIQLLELHEIVELMKKPCAFDFRSVMLMPPRVEEEVVAQFTTKKGMGKDVNL